MDLTGRDLDIDSQRRHGVAPIHLDLHLLALDGEVLGNDGQDLLAQKLDKRLSKPLLHNRLRAAGERREDSAARPHERKPC